MAKKNKPARLPPPVDLLASLPPSPAETARLHQVFIWIVQGQTEREIVDAIHSHWPDQEPGPLIEFAVDQIRKSANYDPVTVRGWAFEAYRELYRKALELNDLAAALRAIAKIADMTGTGVA